MKTNGLYITDANSSCTELYMILCSAGEASTIENALEDYVAKKNISFENRMKAGDMARKIDSIFENTDEIRVADIKKFIDHKTRKLELDFTLESRFSKEG